MAKQKKEFKIETPKGAIIKRQIKSGEHKGEFTAQLKWNDGFAPKKKKEFTRKQEYVDSECIRKMTNEEIHPRRTGALVKSATLGTAIGSGEIHQIAPYARRQYYEHKEKSYWFERMKNRHKDAILKGAEKIE